MGKPRLRRRVAAVLAAAAALCVSAVLGLSLAFGAGESDSVAYSQDANGNKVYYADINSAIQAGYTGKTIVMIKDWYYDGQGILIDQGKSLTIDMDGHVISQVGKTTALTNGFPTIVLGANSNLTLKSSASKTYAASDFSPSASWKETVTTGGIVTGGFGHNGNTGAGAIWLHRSSTLTLDNVGVIANKSSDSSFGGAITLRGDKSTLNLNNAAIDYNKGVDGGAILVDACKCTVNLTGGTRVESNNASGNGGGISISNVIYSRDDACTLNIEGGSNIRNNHADKNGGGIYTRSSCFDIASSDKSGQLQKNTADGDGGAIYLKQVSDFANEGNIKGLRFNDNRCSGNGAGIYVGQQWTYVSDCKMNLGQAGKSAGAIYIDARDTTVSNCDIQDNMCARGTSGCKGGAILVPSRYDLTLGGMMVVSGNHNGGELSGPADDITLESNANGTDFAYVTGGVEKGSSVGLRCNTLTERRLGKSIVNYIDDTFFIDDESMHVDCVNGALWQRKGQRLHTVTLNGKTIGSYKRGEWVVINPRSADPTKVFKGWNLEKSTGLDEDRLKNAVSSSLQVRVASSDIHLYADYMDYLDSLEVTLHKPVVGKGPVRDISLTWTYEGQEHTKELKYAGLSDNGVWWHSVDGDSYTYVDGKVEAGKSYMANVRVVSSGSTTLAISSLTKVTVKWDDGTDAQVAKQELLETGSDILSIDTVPITVESTQVASGVQASAVTGVSASLQGASVVAGLDSAASASAANATADIAVKCTDTALYAKGEAHWSDSFTVTGKVGQSLTITPATQEGRQFDHWEWADAPKGCDLTAYELTIPSLKAAMSGKITAVYAPVISELSVEGLSVPTKVGQELSADVTSIKAKAGGSGDAGLTDLTSYFVGDSGKGAVSWSPNDTVTAADTAYTAAILIDSTAAKNGVKYVLADDADVYVAQDGEKCEPWWSCIEDGIFCVGFWPTERFELQGVKDASMQLSYEEAYRDQAAADVAGYDVCAFALPEYALVSVSAQGLGDAAATLTVPVEWTDTPKLDTSKKEAQTLVAHGKVTLPDEVDQNGKSLDVTMTIEVAAPVKVATPKASVASGTYDAAQWVYLSCDSDDVTLRYTLDGSEPTARSQAYTGFPLTLDSSTQLRVVAVSNDSDAASDVASYDYTIDAVTRTITLDTGAGSKLEPMKVVNGAWAYPDEEPVLEGYRFVGWKLDGDWFLFYTPVTSDITLTAVWEDARPSVADAKVTLSKAKLVYSGKKQAPSLKSVVYDGTKLKQGTDYKVKIVKGKKVGTYAMKVTGMGDYQGMTSASYRIVPAKVKGVSAKAAGKHKAKVTWKAHKAQTTGFKVRWAASAKALKQGKAVKTALVKKAAATSCTVKGLQSGKKAYVQVRAYKVVDGKKIWSSWSKAVGVKVK